jgi:hypothetical protein
MATAAKNNVDYRLLSRLSSLVLCSTCFQQGRVTPVPQLITATRRPTNLCPSCRAKAIREGGLGRLIQKGSLAKVLQFKAG